MRRIFILLCCIMLMFALACSASAVAYGWEDFVTAHGTTPNGVSFAECTFPSSMGRINVYNGNTFIEGVSGGSVTRSWSAGQIPRFRYLPFGQQGTSAVGVGKLALKQLNGNNTYGIPNGTHLYFDLEITGNAATLSNASVIASVSFYDQSESFLSEVIVDMVSSGSLPYILSFDYVMDAPSDAYFVAIYVDMRSNSALSSSTSIGINASDLWMRGDGLVYHDWKVSLDDIKDSLYDKFDPINPDEMGPDDLDGIEENNRNFFAEMGSEVFGFFNYILEHINDFIEPLLFVSALMSLIINIPVFGWLLYLSACVGFVGLILGIAPTVLSYKSETTRAREAVGRYIRTHPDRSQPIRQNGVNRFDVARAVRKSRR